MSSGGPRMYLNMEDHVSHSLKKPNIPLEVLNITFLCLGATHQHNAQTCSIRDASVLRASSEALAKSVVKPVSIHPL